MAGETDLAAVRQYMHSVNVPGHHDKVFKDECMFSFSTPLSPGGLYVNLATWQGFGADYVQLDAARTGQALYLMLQAHQVPLSREELQEVGKPPAKLALGLPGGFQPDAPRHKVVEETFLAVLPQQLQIRLPCPDLPEVVLSSLHAIQKHDSASRQEAVATWEHQAAVSRYAEALEQLPTDGRTIPSDPTQWRCDESGVTENLWLNLSTGVIGSGRPQPGAPPGLSGNGAALRHFEATGRKYPLAVKLGTITAHGADVYSYAPDEDDMVIDPKLGEHLRHWGINLQQMEKTERSLAEHELLHNQSAFDGRVTEAGAELERLSGPGFVGLQNLGNSCYMNSVMQTLWTIPRLQQRYVDAARHIFESAPEAPANDFVSQMAKLGVALTTGSTGQAPTAARDDGVPNAAAAVAVAAQGVDAAGRVSGAGTALSGDAEGTWVRPQRFKSLVGKGHAEFSSSRQQDAAEYFQHLLDVLTRAERAGLQRLHAEGEPPTADLFRFELEDRVQCNESRRVSYKRSVTNVLGLHIPLEAATNKSELAHYQEREKKRAKLQQEQASAYIGPDSNGQAAAVTKDDEEVPVLPRVPFDACLERLAAPGVIDDYFSPALGRKGRASTQTRVRTFPPYLMVQLKRYYVADDWTPRKLEVLVEPADTLDLEQLRSRWPVADEQLQPEEPAESGGAAAGEARAPAAPAPAPVQASAEIVAQLTAMGFSENGCKRAAMATQNAGAEPAMQWVLEHMGDENFNDPLPAADGPAAGAADTPPDQSSLEQLQAFGFTEAQAAAALKACHGSLERAGDWLFSHAEDLDAAVASVQGSDAAAAAGASEPDAADPKAQLQDGPAHYTLSGFISHQGRNTGCGHYVCHLRKGGRWVIFNDEKVAVSKSPPKDLAYMYLYRRDDMPA